MVCDLGVLYKIILLKPKCPRKKLVLVPNEERICSIICCPICSGPVPAGFVMLIVAWCTASSGAGAVEPPEDSAPSPGIRDHRGRRTSAWIVRFHWDTNLDFETHHKTAEVVT